MPVDTLSLACYDQVRAYFCLTRSFRLSFVWILFSSEKHFPLSFFVRVLRWLMNTPKYLVVFYILFIYGTYLFIYLSISPLYNLNMFHLFVDNFLFICGRKFTNVFAGLYRVSFSKRREYNNNCFCNIGLHFSVKSCNLFIFLGHYYIQT